MKKYIDTDEANKMFTVILGERSNGKYAVEKQLLKQAKIDVLNEVKERAVGLAAIETYHICNLIDKLIEEVQNEN